MTRDTTADYDKVIVEAFERLRKKFGDVDAMPFEKVLLETVTRELSETGDIRPIRNIPDIKYTYDARRDFPAEIAKFGHWAITGRGKGKYTFERISRNNLIRIPGDLEAFQVKREVRKDQTPSAVAQVLGDDEQATMTRLRYNDLLSAFFGFSTHQVQGHERTNLSCGQIEVDEVYVGIDGSKKYIIPISGKGGDKDCLSYTQALNLSIYAQEKSRYRGYFGRPLGVAKQSHGEIFVVEFNCVSRIHDLKIERVGAYRLT
jgi:hypothetical protein